MFLGTALHLCGQMKILNSKFADCFVGKSHNHDSFNTLVERHIYLINRAKELIETVNFFLLVKLFIMSILLCIMGFQCILALQVNNYIIVWKSLMVLCSFLTQLTLYCFTGEYLKSQMEKVATSIYQSVWYEFPEQVKKSIIFVIMRRESSVSLQAGNFIFVNLETYMSILKTSLSYISVLRVMMEP
ncbi:odorant receptor 13a-like [Pseudomyrmex gracilis]|uniref:odorant receptor 13a-like n=1 Tax=Pseudomyrmex gracilis TaxID=219809 RepID=UPI000995982F|nr:odorant receptor 13a-like [Pseudomyrmex gracilis]